MFNSRRKVISISLAVAMTVTSIFSLGEKSFAAEQGEAQVVKTAEVADEQVNAVDNQIILHAKAPDSNSLYVWAWDSKGVSVVESKAWPGDLMSKDSAMGDGWYTYTLNGASGFLIHNNGNMKTPDTEKDAGEYWYMDGTFTEYNPLGPTPDPTEAPTPTPRPTNGLADIKSVSPAEGSTFKVNEAATISVDAVGSSDIKFYKYEVKLNGVYVSDHYYSTNEEYTFTPTEQGDYTITVSAQAHDEVNTTDSITLKYKVGENSDIVDPPKTPEPTGDTTPTPDPTGDTTPTPDPTGDTTPTPDPTDDTTPTPDPTDDTTPTPDPTGDTTPTPDPTGNTTPGPTDKPTQKPTDKPTQKPTDKPTQKPTNKPTQTPTNKPTQVPTNKPTSVPVYKPLSLSKVTLSKKSGQLVGSKIKITATAKGGQGNYRYTFIARDNSSKKIYRLTNMSKQNYIYWKPTKAGKYTLTIRLYDNAGNGDMKFKTISYTIKAKPVSIKSLKGYRRATRKIQFKAAATGGTQKLYSFYATRNGKKVLSRGYSTKNNVTWKFSKKGTYRVYVKVKDKSTGIVKTKRITYRVK